jgi:hypothetical protein
MAKKAKVHDCEIKDLAVGQSFLVECENEMVEQQKTRTYIWNRIRLSRVKNELKGWQMSARYSKEDSAFIVKRIK